MNWSLSKMLYCWTINHILYFVLYTIESEIWLDVSNNWQFATLCCLMRHCYLVHAGKRDSVCVQRTSLNPHILTYSTTILLQHSNQKCHWPRGPVTSHPQSYGPSKWFLGLDNAAGTWSRAIPYPEVSGMGEPSDIVSLTMTQLVGWFGFQMNDWQNIVYEDFLSPWSATFCDL